MSGCSYGLRNASQCNENGRNCPKISQKQKIFFSKEFYVDKEAGRAYFFFSRRDVAQSGSALEWGSRGRRFKSFHPDQKAETPRDLRKRRSLFCFQRVRSAVAGSLPGSEPLRDRAFAPSWMRLTCLRRTYGSGLPSALEEP